jgi:hypothetical protein
LAQQARAHDDSGTHMPCSAVPGAHTARAMAAEPISSALSSRAARVAFTALRTTPPSNTYISDTGLVSQRPAATLPLPPRPGIQRCRTLPRTRHEGERYVCACARMLARRGDASVPPELHTAEGWSSRQRLPWCFPFYPMPRFCTLFYPFGKAKLQRSYQHAGRCPRLVVPAVHRRLEHAARSCVR